MFGVAIEEVQTLTRNDIGEDNFQIRTTQGLLLQQFLSQNIESVAVFLQDGVGLVMSLIDQQTNLLINGCCHRRGVVQRAAATAADERIALLLPVLHRTELR